jgi:acyl carrier protein
LDARIQQIFRDVLDDGKLEVTSDLSPVNTPAWDSFAHVKLITAIEDEYKLSFTMDEVADVTSAGDFVKALRAHGIDVE